MASIQIAPQTKLASVGYFMIVISMIIVSLKSFTWQSLVTIGVYVAFAILALYVVNCTVYGQCLTYAWIVAYLLVALGVFAIVGTIYNLVSGKAKN